MYHKVFNWLFRKEIAGTEALRPFVKILLSDR
jgi:hypothetical protein